MINGLALLLIRWQSLSLYRFCINIVYLSFFFFSSRRRHTRYWRDWSSDVCSSDLDVAVELLGFAIIDERIEQLRRVRMRRVLQQRRVADGDRRPLGGIDDLDRNPRFLQREHIVLVAVRLDGAFALRELLRRLGRGLHLHDALLPELLEVVPAESPAQRVRRGHDGAAVAGVRLH